MLNHTLIKNLTFPIISTEIKKKLNPNEDE